MTDPTAIHARVRGQWGAEVDAFPGLVVFDSSAARYVRRGHKTTQSVNNSAKVNTALDIPPSSGGLVGMERRLVQNLGDLGLGQRTAEEVTEVAFDG